MNLTKLSRVDDHCRDKINYQSIQMSTHFKTLDRQTQSIIWALLDNREALPRQLDHQTLAITELLNRMEVVIMDEHSKTWSIIVNALQHPKDRRSSCSITRTKTFNQKTMIWFLRKQEKKNKKLEAELRDRFWNLWSMLQGQAGKKTSL